MAIFHDVSALKATNAKKDTMNRMQHFGLLAAFSVSALSLIDAIVPPDTDGYEEFVIVSILFIIGAAAKSWPRQQVVKKQLDFSPVAVLDSVTDDSEVAAECMGNDAGDCSMAADPLRISEASNTHDDMDVECVTPSEPQLAKDDVEDTVCGVVKAVANLEDPSCVYAFFGRMESAGLEPSDMMREVFLSICLRKSDAIRAQDFLMRLLRVSYYCDIDALTSLAESCAEANDLALTDNLDAAYVALVHTCVLLEA